MPTPSPCTLRFVIFFSGSPPLAAAGSRAPPRPPGRGCLAPSSLYRIRRAPRAEPAPGPPGRGCVTGSTTRPGAVVIPTDLIAGRHDTRSLGRTRRSVRGTAPPAAHLRACVQTRPAAREAGSPSCWRPGRRARSSERWPRPSTTDLPWRPIKREPSLYVALAGPAPHRPLTHSRHPRPEFGTRRGVAGVSRPATPLGCRAPRASWHARFRAVGAQAAAGEEEGTFPWGRGAPFPAGPGRGRPPAPSSTPCGQGVRPPNCCGHPARDPATEAAESAERGPRGDPEPSPAFPPPRPAAEGLALQPRNRKLLGVEGVTRSD